MQVIDIIVFGVALAVQILACVPVNTSDLCIGMEEKVFKYNGFATSFNLGESSKL